MSDPYVGGKGDRQRPHDKQLFDIGYDMAFGKTPEIRAAAKDRWLDYMSSPPCTKDNNVTD